MYRIISEEELKRKLTTNCGSFEINKPIIKNYFMPKIECPWTPKCNPNIGAKELNESKEYLLKCCNVVDDRVREYIANVGAGELALWWYPFAEKHRLVNIVNFFHFITLIDDHEDCVWGDAHHMSKSMQFWSDISNLFAVKQADISSTPIYFRETKIIFDKIMVDLSEKQKQIFRDLMLNWFLSNQYTETSNKSIKILDFQSQLENRVFNVGMIWSSFLIEYGMNFDLNDFERSHPLMIEYCDVLIKQSLIVNDLYSFRKEYNNSNGDLSHFSNTMASLINYHKLDINTAVLLMKAKIEECNDNCDRIKREIIATNQLFSLNVEKWLIGAEYIMSGNLLFHKTSPRYHGTHFFGDISNSLISLSNNN